MQITKMIDKMVDRFNSDRLLKEVVGREGELKEAKKPNITAWIVLILFLIAGGYALGFLAYKDYESDFNSYTQSTMNRFGELENNLQGFSIALENTVDKSRIEREKLLSEMETLKEDFQSLKDAYRTSLADLNVAIEGLKIDRLTRTVEKLQDDLDGVKMTMQDLSLRLDDMRGEGLGSKAGIEDNAGVDLGKISVRER